jgi:inosine-uridine nucleoside N-ribohydrolase
MYLQGLREKALPDRRRIWAGNNRYRRDRVADTIAGHAQRGNAIKILSRRISIATPCLASVRWMCLLLITATCLMTSYSSRGDEAEFEFVPLVVITDMEPDDRIALHLAAALFPDRLALVGTTVMHSFRKMLLAERLLQQLGLGHIPVVQGSGGNAASYPEVRSSSAARAYDHEGVGILDEQTLLAANIQPRTSPDLQAELRRVLSENLQVEFLILAPPTDLVLVLTDSPELIERVAHIHLMGGWVDNGSATEPELRSTYNWNMDPASAAQLLRMRGLAITIYSSHTIKHQFAGGSVQQANYPNIVALLNDNADALPSVAETIISGASWDNHVMDQIPALESVIGRENAGQQFSPADPIVVVGAYRPELALEKTSVSISLVESDLDPARGFRILLEPAPDSRIELIEKIDEAIFERVFVDAFEEIL